MIWGLRAVNGRGESAANPLGFVAVLSVEAAAAAVEAAAPPVAMGAKREVVVDGWM